MKHFAPTMPAHLYPDLDWGNYHLLQAHTLVDCPETLGWIETELAHPQSGHHVILDNGLIELGHADVDSLLKIAAIIHPDEAICPDAAFKADETCELFRAHAAAVQEHCEAVMTVPQGKCLTEWCDCVERLTAYASEMRINIVFGVSKLINTFKIGKEEGVAQSPRQYALMWLSQFMMNHDFWHQVHLLGVHDDFHIACAEAADNVVRGLDTTLPYAAALAGRLVGPVTAKYELTPQDWGLQPDGKTMRLTEINIAYCRWRLSRG